MPPRIDQSIGACKGIDPPSFLFEGRNKTLRRVVAGNECNATVIPRLRVSGHAESTGESAVNLRDPISAKLPDPQESGCRVIMRRPIPQLETPLFW